VPKSVGAAVELGGVGTDVLGPGTPVELWGDAVSIDEVAESAGTLGYELMCAVAPRVRRRVV